MELLLKRRRSTAEATIGELLVDGTHECFTLEDVVRPDGVKIFGETAIGAGTYAVQITPSPRFKRDLPLLLDVKNFVGVRIHTGNTAADTEGCILVGTSAGKDRVDNSRVAFDALFAKLRAALNRGEAVEITIENAA